ncbi:MAG: hypothetical protein KF819_29390 [Labilithrix sp.]|nr:hypothetical protein [Labilithrix sp.]
MVAACSSDPAGQYPLARELAGARLPDTGALVDIAMDSRVGVLLDEIPLSVRDRVVEQIMSEPESFWTERAARQVELATHRLVFRGKHYDNGSHKGALPLPPASQRTIRLQGEPRRIAEGAHDTIVVSYRFEGTLLTDVASPGISEPRLAAEGGAWDESFMFPIDPALLFQRTRYACMNEADLPPGSVDGEEVDRFYDQDCKDEATLSRFGQCHATERPGRSCRQAIVDEVGAVDTVMRFTRRGWDPVVAERVRVSEISSDTKGADLRVVKSERARVIYRYVAPNACEVEEKCVTGTGWRRLVQFSTAVENVGDKALAIGAVDYYGSGAQTSNATHNVVEYSSCRAQYDFRHYGAYTVAPDAKTSKRASCIQSTARTANHELSPLHNPYGACDDQGVEVGWADEQRAGTPCQWVDVTDIDTSIKPARTELSVTANPEGLLCEGEPVLDPQGRPELEETAFRTASGATVFKPKCSLTPDHAKNNVHAYEVVLPSPGEGMITGACARGAIGPLRNCGFTATKERFTCQVGSVQRLHCELQGSGPAQILRLCDYSQALGAGVPCRYEESIHNVAVDATASGGVDIAFACPAARGDGEPGGTVAIYTAAVVDGDPAVPIVCRAIGEPAPAEEEEILEDDE